MKRYLYHYTSIDTLEKILHTKSMCFTNLDLVDDLEEVETADVKKFGKFCYVSCWTNEEKESIPMWKMYTPDMQGVRIALEEFPFKKYIIQPKQFSNDELIDTYINVIERDKKNLPFVSMVYPQLIEVDYTEREELLYPKIKTENRTFVKDFMVVNGEIKPITRMNMSTKYDIRYIGEFKRKCWEFQKEWRYKIFSSPYTYRELANCKSFEEHIRLGERWSDEDYKPKEERIFLELDSVAVSKMEILIGPRATDEQIEKIMLIAADNGLEKANIRKSGLRIR